MRAAEFAERGRTAQRRGDADAALAHYEDALSLLEDEGDASAAADILRWKGAVLRERGDTTAAHRFFSRSLAMAERLGYVNGQAHALNCLGTIAQRRGDLPEAAELYKAAAHFAEASSDSRLLGLVEMNQGVVAGSLGDWDASVVWFRLSLKTFDGIHDLEGTSYALNNLGMQYAARGRYSQASECFQRAINIAYEREDIIVEATVELNMADLHIRQDELVEATRSVARALKIAETRQDRLRIAEALRVRARVERARGQLDDAMESLREARYQAREGEDALLRHGVASRVGRNLACPRRLRPYPRCAHRSPRRFPPDGRPSSGRSRGDAASPALTGVTPSASGAFRSGTSPVCRHSTECFTTGETFGDAD